MLNLKEVKEYAIKRHSDQKYGDKPYSYQLFQVAEVLTEFGFDSEEYLKEHSEFSKQLKTESTEGHPIWEELDSLFQR